MTYGRMEQKPEPDNLKDEDIRIRASNIIASGKTGDRNAIGSLVEILENRDEVDWLRGCAAIALGRISGEEVIPPLLNALKDESMVVSRSVILALGDVSSEQVIPHLQEILTNQGKKELHALTINVLGQIGGREIIPTLLRALESSSVEVRCSAALALGTRRTRAAVLPFLKLMHDSHDCLRAIAASSLGLNGDKRAVEPLIEALTDGNEEVRAIAASSLGYLGDSRAIPPLERTLDDSSKTVRKQAAAALSKLDRKGRPVKT
jgi:HEAT repeat protein